MDLSGFVRRFSQSSADVRQLPNKPPQNLTVDTTKANTMLKDLPPQWTGSSPINILSGMRNMRNSTSSIPTDNNASESPPGSGRTSESATPTSARSSFSGSSDNNNNNSSSSYNEQMMRRRRSNSECLMLAKSRGGADLPGPCKEYIQGVKQILARSEETSQPALLRRRRSMSLNKPPLSH